MLWLWNIAPVFSLMVYVSMFRDRVTYQWRGCSTSQLYTAKKCISAYASVIKFQCSNIRVCLSAWINFFCLAFISRSSRGTDDVIGIYRLLKDFKSISIYQKVAIRKCRNFAKRIAILWKWGLPSFTTIPSLLTKIWRHKFSTLCREFCDVITPSFLMLPTWNFVKYFLLTSKCCS